jgi:hypothetical protein
VDYAFVSGLYRFSKFYTMGSCVFSVGIGAGELKLGTELRVLFPDGCDSLGACLTAGEFTRILPMRSGLRPIEFARAVLCRRRLLHVR